MGQNNVLNAGYALESVSHMRHRFDGFGMVTSVYREYFARFADWFEL